MKLSARNVLSGTIRKIELGAVNAEITIEIAPGVEMVSVTTASRWRGWNWRRARRRTR